MNEQRDLGGMSALVTGATSGIGKAAAEALGRRSAQVIVHGRDVTRGGTVVDAITAEGGKARFVADDLNNTAELDELVEQAGPVDILVNNAGFSWFGPTHELDVETFDRLFAANVRAPYFLAAALAPKMAARGRGSIINVASMAGLIGLPGGAAYGATKAALASMTRSWAAEFSPAGVRVNAVAATSRAARWADDWPLALRAGGCEGNPRGWTLGGTSRLLPIRRRASAGPIPEKGGTSATSCAF